jgi:Holliday junction resolvase RusA-like endonuclease
MPKVIAFTVFGDARPQGSTRGWSIPVRDAQGQPVRDGDTGRVVMRQAITHSNRDSLMQWRQDIRAAIQREAAEATRELLKGPVAVRVVFYRTRPPSVSKKTLFPITAPDLDKLERAVGDAFEKVLLRNDSQIVHWDVWKIYTEGPSKAMFEIWTPDQLPVFRSETNPFQEALF